MRRGPGRHPGAGVVFGDAQQVTERVTLLQHVLPDLVTGPIGRSGRDVLVGHVAKERRNGVRVVRRGASDGLDPSVRSGLPHSLRRLLQRLGRQGHQWVDRCRASAPKIATMLLEHLDTPSEIRANLCHALAVVKISIRSGWHNVVPGRSWQPNFTPGAANRHSLMLALIPVCGTRQSGFVERPPPRWQPT